MSQDRLPEQEVLALLENFFGPNTEVHNQVSTATREHSVLVIAESHFGTYRKWYIWEEEENASSEVCSRVWGVG